MKLELKHLAPYLPYNVYVGDGRTPFKLTEHNFTNVFKYLTTIYLHPLSDLTKVIEVNGEKFVPSTLGLNLPLDNLISEEILKLKYTTVQKLLEWHFDIHGLIENGLAIDINTLNYE